MKSKKHIYLPIAILLYAIIMAIYSYRTYNAWTNQLTIVLIIEVAIAILLYILLKKRYDNMNK